MDVDWLSECQTAKIPFGRSHEATCAPLISALEDGEIKKDDSILKGGDKNAAIATHVPKPKHMLHMTCQLNCVCDLSCSIGLVV